MSWGDWMVPEVTPTAAFNLERNKRVLRSSAADHPEEILAFAIAFLEQNVMLQSIITKATKRIAELEVTQLLGDPPAPSPTTVRLRSDRDQIPVLLRVLLWIYGYRQAPNHDE